MTAKTIPLVVIAVFLLAQIVWVSLSPALAQAAPVVSSGTVGTMLTGDGTSKLVSYTIPSSAAPGRILVVSVASDDRINKISGITYGGRSLSQAYGTGQLAPSSITARIQMFYLLDPPTGAAQNLIFTASAPDSYVYVIAYVSGADIASVGTVSNNSGTGSTLTVSNTPGTTGSLIVTAFGNDSTVAYSPSGGSTEVSPGESSVSGIHAGLYYKAGGSAGSPVSVAASAGFAGWGAIAMEVKPYIALPEVSVYVENNDAQEPGDISSGINGSFTFSRSSADEDYSDSLNIDFDRDGSATYNVDYLFDEALSSCDNVSGDTVTIPAEETDCVLVVRPVQDTEFDEETETVEIAVNDDTYYDLGASYSGTVYIANTPDQSGGEGGGEEMGPCTEYWCVYTDYSIDAPGYASIYIYDDDTVPSGQITGDGLTATPSRVKSGNVATLSWSVTGMTTCSISDDDGNNENDIGSVDAIDGPHTATTPAINTRTTFTLTCSDGSASVVSRAVVGIVPSFIEQ